MNRTHKNKVGLTLILVLVFAFSCKKTKDQTESFEIFLDEFINDSNFQEKRISSYVNLYQIPENDSVVQMEIVRKIKSSKIGFINLKNDHLYAKKEYLDKDEGYEIKIKYTKDSDSIVYSQIGLGDNLLNYNYVFKRVDKKWFLTDILELTP